MTKREKINKLKAFVRQPHAWPGGYSQIMIANDGVPICHKCVKEEFRNILHSTKFDFKDGWAFENTFINWEDENTFCGHCNKKIPSEYGDNIEPQDEQMQEETLKHRGCEEE